jgi:Asp-tRNA(Asn)/Glu-tRNA(Gln) amidotransferase A subunit family amidase
MTLQPIDTGDGSPLDWPIAEIAGRVKRRQISAVEVLESYIERVESDNSRLNAIVTRLDDRAVEQAKAIDDATARGIDAGPLAGVPFTVKDLIATRDVRATAGSLILRDFVPSWGATAVDRLAAAGALLLGKTNCPEFGLAIHTGNRLFGDTFNPLDTRLSPGGSSGGDAAAVAARMARFGIGTDYGGSIRLPAHCTGLVSLRPTPGLVPGTGQLPFAASRSPVSPNSASMQARLQTIAPIARSIPDLWILLEVMAGTDGIDTNAVPVALGSPSMRNIPGTAVAWCDGDGSYPVRADVAKVVEVAADALSDLGARVINRRPPGLDEAESAYASLRDLDGLPDHERLWHGREDELTDYVRGWLARSRPDGTWGDFQRLTAIADAIRLRVSDFMKEWPILLMPVASVPAFAPRSDKFVVGGQTLHGVQIESCCRVVTLLRAPTVVVPCGLSDEGLPVGVQIIGRPYHDAQVVAVAEELAEYLGPWQRMGRGGVG